MAYLTDKERKKPIVHLCDWYEFTSCVDLSQGVKIRPIIDKPEYRANLSLIARDVASFTTWWIINFHGDLNGFSGVDTIKWEMI